MQAPEPENLCLLGFNGGSVKPKFDHAKLLGL